MHGVAALDAYRLLFSKIGADGSGKATLVRSTSSSDRVYGVVFAIETADLLDLDRIEGPGYERLEGLQAVSHPDGVDIRVTTYFAREGYVDASLHAFDWYLALVMKGAETIGLPEDYRSQLAMTPVYADPDQSRWTRLEALAVLGELESYK